MNYAHLKRRVERHEALVEGRIRQTGECHARLLRDWREAWTPLRIVLAGLATGFIAGRAEPEKALKKLGSISGPRTMQLISSVAGLAGTVQAAIAAMTASSAADSADQAAGAARDAAAEADGGNDQPPPETAPGSRDAPAGASAATAPSQARRRPDPHWDSQPSPAEAATELSER